MHRNVYHKALIVLAIFGGIAATPAFAATLSWKASTGEPAGYKVYYGTSSSPSQSVDVGNVTSFSLDKLPLDGKTRYYFSVSAYNSAGESGKSPSVAYTTQDATPPTPPSGLTAK